MKDIDQNLSRGAFVGLAVGDALGAPVEFKKPGTFEKITDFKNGGPFDLEAGDYTDDTSLALCLAESLVKMQKFDLRDQIMNYVKYKNEGFMSSKNYCFDIGTTTISALHQFEINGAVEQDIIQSYVKSNGSIMRLAPVVLAFANNPIEAIKYAGKSTKNTHHSETHIAACEYLAVLILGGLQKHSKEEILNSRFAPKNAERWWKKDSLFATRVDRLRLYGDYKDHDYRPKATMDVVDTLGAALWAFYTTSTFEDGAIAAVNLGGDSDTVGAVYGQIAGAYYGLENIPQRWKSNLKDYEMIVDFSDKLIEMSTKSNADLSEAHLQNNLSTYLN